jgi:hypothetical protein
MATRRKRPIRLDAVARERASTTMLAALEEKRARKRGKAGLWTEAFLASGKPAGAR